MRDWYKQGYDDYGRGLTESNLPGLPESEASNAWLKGWRGAAEDFANSPATKIIEGVLVSLKIIEGKFYLVDSQGRVLGTQARIDLTQESGETNAAVTFLGLKISAD